MKRLNYKHLRYFHTVASEGSIQAAAELLHLTPQTISGQLRSLEQELGVELFVKTGRNLQLTDAGRLALNYSHDIFQLGTQLQEALVHGEHAITRELRVGIVDALSKSIAQQLVAPAISGNTPMRLICREQPMPELLGELAVHNLDLVLADSPIPSGLNIRCYSHLLGSSPLACFAASSLTTEKTFPDCLHSAPLLLPTETHSGVRASLISWLGRHQIRPFIAGEFDDSALLKAFGRQGHGYFFAPAVIKDEVCRTYHVQEVGIADDLSQAFYAISAEPKVQSDTLKRIVEAATHTFTEQIAN